MKQKFST